MTLAEIADELGVDESTAHRIVGGVLAKLRRAFHNTEHPPEMVAAALVIVLRERAANDFSSVMSIPRKFSRNAGESSRAGHAVQSASPSSVDVQRARHPISRRWRRSP